MIYLVQKEEFYNAFFLRIIRKNNLKEISFDEKIPVHFSPDKGGFLPNGESMDLLKVWVKPTDALFPSVLFSETPINPNVSSSSKKIKIKLIHTQTNKTYEEVDFVYANAPLESHKLS